MGRSYRDMMTPAERIGERIGRAMARDVLADGLPRAWTGLDPQDGDQLTAAGFEPGTAQWDEAVRAAKFSYELSLVVYDLTGHIQNGGG